MQSVSPADRSRRRTSFSGTVTDEITVSVQNEFVADLVTGTAMSRFYHFSFNGEQGSVGYRLLNVADPWIVVPEFSRSDSVYPTRSPNLLSVSCPVMTNPP